MSNTRSITLKAGSGQYLDAGDTASLSITGDLTIEFWIFLPAGTGDVNFSKYGVANNYSWQAYIDSSENWTFIISSDGVSTTAKFAALGITDSVWAHVAFVYTAASGKLQVYLNTTQVGADVIGLPTSIFDGTSTFRVTSGRTTDIKLDDIRIWNTPRTQAELAANYQRELAGNESGLVAYWKLNNSYVDTSSNGNNLTPSGTPTFTTSVPFTDATTTSTTRTTTSTSTTSTSTSKSTSRTTSTSTSRTQSQTTSTSTTSTSRTTSSTSTSLTTTSTSTTSTSTTLELTFSVERI